MSEYTEYLELGLREIEPESKDYLKKLIEITKSFRSFDAALDDFLLDHGFSGDIHNIEEKVQFIELKFKEAGIPKPRNARAWYQRHLRPDSTRRSSQIQICFAFELSPEQARDFFRRVCLERDFDCHDLEELVYFFALKNGMSYQAARKIIEELPDVEHERFDECGDVLYTQRIRREVETFTRVEELRTYIEDHLHQFAYHNASGTIRIRELWEEIASVDGLCVQERELLQQREGLLPEEELHPEPSNLTGSRKERRADPTSAFGILLQILGLSQHYSSGWGKDRSLKPVLAGNEAIHPIAESVFPDRDGIEKVLHGEQVSYERIRKILILLLFYRYWIETVLDNAASGEEFPYEISGDEHERFAAYMNDELTDVGLQELYEGNPYDWIFLFASSAKTMDGSFSPLDNLRGYMMQLVSVSQLET